MWEHIYFYSCLEWRANYLWLWIQTRDPSRFDYSTFVNLVLTSYFVVSKWWPISESNKYILFSARKFRQHRTAIYTPSDFQSDFEILNNLRTYDKHYDSLLFKGLNPARISEDVTLALWYSHDVTPRIALPAKFPAHTQTNIYFKFFQLSWLVNK